MALEWKEVEEFPEYLVNELGDILNTWTSHTMKPRYNNEGFAMVNFSYNRKINTRSLALIVAKAFAEPPRNSAYNSVIHLNGDRTDYRAMNLMFRPRWFAIRYHKMFEHDPIRVAVYIPKINQVYHSLREACTTYGLIERDTYHCILNRDFCFHYGWEIERYEE